MIILLSGCAKEHLINEETETQSANIQTSSSMPFEKSNGIISCEKILDEIDVNKFETALLIGNDLIYCINQDRKSDAVDAEFFCYSLEKKTVKKIGLIKNRNTYTNTYSVHGEKIFSTFAVIENNKILNKHFLINLECDKISSLSIDDEFPPLVYTYFLNVEQYVEFQPKKRGENLYLYTVTLFDTENQHTQTIISKEINIKNNFSEAITAVNTYENSIYTAETVRKNEKKSHYICRYDRAGEIKEKIFIDEITDFFETNPEDAILSLTVLENQFIIRTLNHKLLGFAKTKSGYELIDTLCNDSFYVVEGSNGTSKKTNKLLLYNYGEEPKFYVYDVNRRDKNELSFNFRNLKNFTFDNGRLIAVDENGIWKVELDM